MAYIPKRNTQLAFAIGSAGSFTTGNDVNTNAGMNIRNSTIEAVQGGGSDSDNESGSLDQGDRVPGAYAYKLSFETDLIPSGTAGTAPKWGPLIQACGYSETIVPATSVTYAPINSSIPVLDLAYYRGGTRYRLHSARGNMTVRCPWAQKPVMLFEFWGIRSTIMTDTALLTGVSYPTILPTAWKELSTATIHTVGSLHSTLFEFTPGNTVQLVESDTASTGYIGAEITERKAMLKIQPLAQLAAAFDLDSKEFAGTVGATSHVFGSGAGNVMTFSCTRAQVVAANRNADRNGLRSNEWDLLLPKPPASDVGGITIAIT